MRISTPGRPSRESIGDHYIQRLSSQTRDSIRMVLNRRPPPRPDVKQQVIAATSRPNRHTHPQRTGGRGKPRPTKCQYTDLFGRLIGGHREADAILERVAELYDSAGTHSRTAQQLDELMKEMKNSESESCLCITRLLSLYPFPQVPDEVYFSATYPLSQGVCTPTPKPCRTKTAKEVKSKPNRCKQNS